MSGQVASGVSHLGWQERTANKWYCYQHLTLTSASSLLIGSLKDKLKKLEVVNKELEDDCEYLDKENDKQASDYVKLKKECSRYKTILKEKFGYSDDDDTEKEKHFKEVLMRNMKYFEQYTDMTSLAPHLITSKLLTNDEWAQIRTNPSPKDAAMHFYTRVLPMKGARAYTTFYYCLKKANEDPDSNSGHKDLMKILFDSVKL